MADSGVHKNLIEGAVIGVKDLSVKVLGFQNGTVWGGINKHTRKRENVGGKTQKMWKKMRGVRRGELT